MSYILLELLFILLLILLNGLLSMAELSIVSARKNRLQQRAEAGDESAKAALQLSENPSQFLSTVQIGITLIGIFTGALGGATMSESLGNWLAQFPWLEPYSTSIAVGLVVLLLGFFSLVLGELVPKQIALNYAESIAAATAPMMKTLAAFSSPFVALLSTTTNFIVHLFGVQRSGDPLVTDEDVRQLIEQGKEVGIFEEIEQEIVGQVFRLSDRTVNALLTPRTDIIWLDINDSAEVVRNKVLEHRFAQFPVADGDLDTVVGVVLIKDLLAQSLDGRPLVLKEVIRQPLFIPESTPALEVVDKLKETGTHIALVIDEYGGLEGMVTLDDIFEAIIGELPNSDEVPEVEEVERDDGTWLIDGMYAVDEFKEKFDLDELPDEEEGYYQTLGGFVMRMLQKIPSTGDSFEYAGLRLEVVDMDGRRVDKVLVARLPMKVEASF